MKWSDSSAYTNLLVYRFKKRSMQTLKAIFILQHLRQAMGHALYLNDAPPEKCSFVLIFIFVA